MRVESVTGVFVRGEGIVKGRSEMEVAKRIMILRGGKDEGGGEVVMVVVSPVEVCREVDNNLRQAKPCEKTIPPSSTAPTTIVRFAIRTKANHHFFQRTHSITPKPPYPKALYLGSDSLRDGNN